jgi:hypothetical protein
MGLLDFLTGGNAKVAANAVADLHWGSNGDYLSAIWQPFLIFLAKRYKTLTEKHKQHSRWCVEMK